MRQVLLAIHTAGHFTELVRVARLLKASGAYAPTLLFARSYQGIQRDVGVCRDEAIAFVEARARSGGEGEPLATAAMPSGGQRARQLLGSLWTNPPFALALARAVARQRQELTLARAIVGRRKPDLLVLAEDGVGYETAALIKAAHERGTAAVIVPFTVSNALEPAEAYFREPAHSLERWPNRLVARAYPRWRYDHRGTSLLRLPAAQALAKEWWGLAPPLPWQMNSGSADAIAVESPFMEAYYRREGLPAEQLVVTGSLADDALAESVSHAASKRAALCTELALPPGRRLVLCAMPPDHLPIAAQQADVPDYQTLVNQWVEALAALPDTNVVVRFHPRTRADDYAGIERAGLRISRLDTASLVPLCDLFVASVSATIRWAIACGKPVLNYDVYRLRWTDFADAQGVLRVEDRAAFVETLNRLVRDPAFFADVGARQKADAPRWGRLDGHAGRRLLECFEQVQKRTDA